MASLRVALVGKNLENIRQHLAKFNITETDEQPDFVITYGGDGTLIGAERDFPQIPKIPIRNSNFCKKCIDHKAEVILQDFVENKLQHKSHRKVEVRMNGKVKQAMNEVGLHMANPASAVRFNLKVNNELYVPQEIIGDGLVIATPFGASAYFRSITRGTFKCGLGLAIVNSVEPVEWAVLLDHEVISVEITRGPASVLADNDPEQWRLNTGDHLEFRVAPQPAVTLGLDALRCKKCQILH